MLRKILIFIAIFISIIQISNAQYGTIEGTVKDSTGFPIIGSSVMIGETNLGAYVGKKDGSFRIFCVPEGFVRLVTRSVGYLSAENFCIVKNDSTSQVNIILEVKKNIKIYINPIVLRSINYDIGTIWIWDSNYYFK